MNEVEYRQRIQQLYDRIDTALDQAGVDPDVLESEQSQGSMTLRFGDGTRCILSAQPSVRQLWMAVAAKGMAFHFDFDPSTGLWKDDKGKGIEPLAYLTTYIRDAAGIEVRF